MAWAAACSAVGVGRSFFFGYGKTLALLEKVIHLISANRCQKA